MHGRTERHVTQYTVGDVRSKLSWPVGKLTVTIIDCGCIQGFDVLKDVLQVVSFLWNRLTDSHESLDSALSVQLLRVLLTM